MSTHGPFGIGEVVMARDRLWRIDQVHKEERKGTKYLYYSVSNITGPASSQILVPTIDNVTKATIPPPDASTIGNPVYQKLLIQAMRLDLIYGTSSFISLQNSKVIPISYQMVPVLMALNLPQSRLLIADDVGLGKTVEAGLIIQELVGRKRVNRVLFVVPANLREQWQTILRNFFGIDAVIMSRRTRRYLESELLVGGNPWGYYNYIIVSTDYAKQSHVKNELIQYPWDLVVVDEAHNVVRPHGGSDNEFTRGYKQSYGLTRALAEHAEHLLLLTATPHNGYRDCFASLLAMVNPAIVDERDASTIQIDRDLATKHVCQRRRDDVKKWLAASASGTRKSVFPERDADEIYVKPSAQFLKTISKLNLFAKKVFESLEERRARARQLPRELKESHLSKWAVIHFHKRCISSPHALVCSVNNRLEVIEEILAKQRDALDITDAFLTPEEAGQAVMDGNESDRLTEEEMDKRTDQIVLSDSIEAIQAEKKILLEVRDEAEKLVRDDTKLYELLENILPRRLKVGPKIILFTRYIDTLTYLVKALEKKKESTLTYRDLDLFSVHGQMPSQVRQERYNEFLKSKRGILVSTDCMAEGIDLQYSANQIINYELTWNPNRLEQRNGRVDRFGQPEPTVYIRNLIIESSFEMGILKALVEKARKIKTDYGFIPSFFGDPTSVIDHILKREKEIARDLAKKRGTLEYWIPVPDQLVEDIVSEFFSEKNVRTVIEDSFYGHTNVNLEEIEGRMRVTEERIGNTQTLLAFVERAVDLLHGTMILEDADEEIYEVSLPIEVQRDMGLDAPSTGGAGKKDEGGKFRLTPNREVGAKYEDVDGLSLKSALVQGLVEKVKNEAFSPDTAFYGRTAAFTSAQAEFVTALYFVKVRYLVHTEPLSIVEEIVPLAVELLGARVLAADVIEAIWEGAMENVGKPPVAIQKQLEKALARPDLEVLLAGLAADRQEALTAERRIMIDTLKRQGIATDLSGLDQVESIGTDLLAVTLIYPKLE